MNFDEILPKLLQREGGYVNDPNDAGGETKYGISKRQYPQLDIKNLTVGEAGNIYYRDYWKKFSIELLPANLREVFLDMCVLQGVGSASRILQKAINHTRHRESQIIEDGIVGAVTRKAAEGLDLVILRGYRLAFLNELALSDSRRRRFWKGWMRRAIEV